MKLLSTVTLGLALSITSLSISQEERAKKSPEERAIHLTDKMSEKLDLSEEKTESLLELNKTYISNLYQIKSNTELSKEEKKVEAKALKDTRKSNLKGLLSAEEFSKLEALRQESKDKKGHGSKTPEEKATAQTQRIENIVQLTSEQKTRVYKVNLRANMKIRAAQNSETKTDEQKKAHVKGIQKDRKNELNKVLTEEQIATLKAHKKNKSQRKENSLKK